jgi:hypothetical protein
MVVAVVDDDDARGPQRVQVAQDSQKAKSNNNLCSYE